MEQENTKKSNKNNIQVDDGSSLLNDESNIEIHSNKHGSLSLSLPGSILLNQQENEFENKRQKPDIRSSDDDLEIVESENPHKRRYTGTTCTNDMISDMFEIMRSDDILTRRTVRVLDPDFNSKFGRDIIFFSDINLHVNFLEFLLAHENGYRQIERPVEFVLPRPFIISLPELARFKEVESKSNSVGNIKLIQLCGKLAKAPVPAIPEGTSKHSSINTDNGDPNNSSNQADMKTNKKKKKEKDPKVKYKNWQLVFYDRDSPDAYYQCKINVENLEPAVVNTVPQLNGKICAVGQFSKSSHVFKINQIYELSEPLEEIYGLMKKWSGMFYRTGAVPHDYLDNEKFSIANFSSMYETAEMKNDPESAEHGNRNGTGNLELVGQTNLNSKSNKNAVLVSV